jgi:hypothetical protein
MDPDAPVHARRPSRSPLRHLLPKRWRAHGESFATSGVHRPARGTANPEESGGSDTGTALKSAVIVMAAAALITWILVDLLR